MIDSGRQKERMWGGVSGEVLGGWRVLDYITAKDWLENFFSLTRSWPASLDKENKQDPSIQDFHSYAKTSVAEPPSASSFIIQISHMDSVVLLLAWRPDCQAAQQTWQEDRG